MSSETRPISPASFAKAIEDLPVENLYAKAYEINNSVKHLEQSNKLLQEYSDSIVNDETLAPDVRAGGDKDCLEAIRENEIVIERQHARIRLLKEEVQRRGQLWHEVEPKEETTNGTTESEPILNGTNNDANSASVDPNPPSTGLTDEQPREQLDARLAAEDHGEEGMHL